jgi:uncharacterized protein YcfJ
MKPMRNAMCLLAAAAGVLAGPAALADRDRHRDSDRGRGWGPPAWAPAHGRHSDSDIARVLHVEPITRRIRVTEPRRECYQETRYEEPRTYYSGSRAPNSAAGQMILGGVLGAALGNQIGSGDGRRAATVAGALIGSAIGHDVAGRRSDRSARDAGRYEYDEGRPYTVERCDVRYDERWDERVEGYWVTYEYHGREYRTRLPYDPGRELRVRVDVSPQR